MAASGWNAVARLFHWGMAAMIFYQLWLGWQAEDMPFSPKKLDLFITHKSIGLTVLLLVVLRLGWRLRSGRPAHPQTTSAWEKRLADVGHWVLYALMMLLPLTGWWISDTSRIPFKLFAAIPLPDLMAADKAASELAASVHDGLTKALVFVLAVHVLAALRHHFLLKDDSLKRMLFSR